MKNKSYKKAILFASALLLCAIYSNAQTNVAVHSMEQEIKLNVYPNPINDKLQLIGMPENGTAHIINMLGIEVLAIKSTARQEEINVSNLRPGIYMLQVCDAQGNCEVRKLVKE